MSRKEQEERNDEILQLDPKKRQAFVKVGGTKVLADPIATLLQPCKACGREIGVDDLSPELHDRLLAAVAAAAVPRAVSNASPIPRGYINMVTGAKARIENALGHSVEGFYPAEVPAILRDNPLALCYPPFAAQFAACIMNADPAVWKVLRSFYEGRGATLRPYTVTARMPVSHGAPTAGTTLRTIHEMVTSRFLREVQTFRVWNAKQAGKSIAEIARDEKLTERTVRERLGQARGRLGLRKRHRAKQKETNSSAR